MLKMYPVVLEVCLSSDCVWGSCYSSLYECHTDDDPATNCSQAISFISQGGFGDRRTPDEYDAILNWLFCSDHAATCAADGL